MSKKIDHINKMTDLLCISTGLLLLGLAVSFGAQSGAFIYLVAGSVSIIALSGWNLCKTQADKRSDNA